MAREGPKRDPRGLQERSKRGPERPPKGNSHPTWLRDACRTLPGPSRDAPGPPPGPLRGEISRHTLALKNDPWGLPNRDSTRPKKLRQRLQNGPK